MKKVIFAILFLSVSTFTFGQYVPKGKMAKAESAYSQKKLDIAKAEADKAFEIDNKGKVTASGKNWYTKGRILALKSLKNLWVMLWVIYRVEEEKYLEWMLRDLSKLSKQKFL